MPISPEKFAFLHSVDLACPYLCYILFLLEYKCPLSDLSNVVLWVSVSFEIFEKIEEIQEKTWIENRAVGYICPALYMTQNSP